jgi:hypothetical protein
MTTFCRIVLTVVSCTIDPATPAPTPADAVAIFRASSPPFQAAPEIEPLPWSVDAPIAYDRDWPFTGPVESTLRVDPTWAPTPLYLDGMSQWEPPFVYRLRPHVRGGWYGQSVPVHRAIPSGPQQRRTAPDARPAGETPLPHAGDTRGSEGKRAVAGGSAPAVANGRARQHGRADRGGAPAAHRR